ncbi:MAG TPA: ribose-phosphate diphosphokinase [Candidatus Binatia bacterium]|jgi:ribose-phosphate pyrophosphokinase|nr:ribose-phosphate diphosphokinase [Candidatus Binatia bacterium]
MRCYTLPEPTPAEKKIAAAVGDAVQARWKTFPSGELFVRVTVESGVVALVGRTAPPAEDFFRTALLADTLRRSGATGVVAAVPYLGYARQDRQESQGDAFSAAFLAGQLGAAGVVRLVTMDVHSDRVREASPLRITSVSPVPDLAPALQVALAGKDFTIVAPDFGARHRAEAFADVLGHREPAWAEKRRDPSTGKVSLMDVHGDLRGDIAVITDDILDTGSTVELAVKMLRAKKFSKIFLVVTHPLFSDGAAARVRRLGIAKIITTNTVPLRKEAAKLPGIKVVDVTARIAAAVREHAITP